MVAVFVDGCFWHGCPEHGRMKPWSGPNADLWADKMRRNAERDERATAIAEEQGWHVYRVWECEVRRDASLVARRVLGLTPDRPGRDGHVRDSGRGRSG